MNKKGFAVSVILYSIVFLIITTLFMLLGIMRTRFNVNNELRENIRETINEEIGTGSLFPSSEKCEIKGNTNDYTENLILTIDVNNGKFYSFDNEVYSNRSSITVNRAGTYTGYYKDNVGGSGSCEVEVISKTRYSYKDCKREYYEYSDWYQDGNITNSGECKTKEEAERNHLDMYCIGDKKYKRNAIGCTNWDASNWNEWQDDFPESFSTRRIKSAILYKIKNT